MKFNSKEFDDNSNNYELKDKLKEEKSNFDKLFQKALNIDSITDNNFDVKKYLPKNDIYSSKMMRKYKNLINNNNNNNNFYNTYNFNNNNNDEIYFKNNFNNNIINNNNENFRNDSISEIHNNNNNNNNDSLFDLDSKIDFNYNNEKNIIVNLLENNNNNNNDNNINNNEKNNLIKEEKNIDFPFFETFYVTSEENIEKQLNSSNSNKEPENLNPIKLLNDELENKIKKLNKNNLKNFIQFNWYCIDFNEYLNNNNIENEIEKFFKE